MILQSLRRVLPTRKPAGPSDLFDAQTLADPYPTYRRLRDEDPVHWDAANGRWVHPLRRRRGRPAQPRRLGRPDWGRAAVRAAVPAATL
jgi:hypothetical protein